MTNKLRPPSALPDPVDPPRDGEDALTLFTQRTEHLLREGRLSNTRGMMRWGSNYAALIAISDSEYAATAVYKPQRGERPLWDFPDGTLCYREVAAYQVSEALGWHLVPPTVLRQGPHGLGSLQYFVAHNPEITYFSLGTGYAPQLQKYALFDYLINNADRKGGHLLLDEGGKLWAIDHGLTFHTTPKLRTVIWDFAGKSIDASLLSAVCRLADSLAASDSPLHTALGTLLSPAELRALVHRVGQITDCKTYPQPGPGPNYPWPPI
ncbi:SCO1664 family protein [Aggregatilinea lenta]|uniref:SCO1664 family protein n=1 Tax=Aggregatilinea lenta TaxID=913108 RepID=UPI000E5C2BEF|nr:SCO1664 family protein [Aggregatilinea lenta]